MTGVKPKMKGNAWKYALLFLFINPLWAWSAGYWPESDTIIIDGDVIYIERDEDPVDLDSLEQAGKNDVIKKPVRTFPWSVGVLGGTNLTLGSFGTSVTDFTPLNNFTDDKKSAKFNLTYGLDFSGRFWSFPALNGTMNLSAHVGVAMNEVDVSCNAIETDSLIRDSIILLRYTDSELYLEHFVRFPPPNEQFGELDTAMIAIKKNTLKYKTLDIPIRLRMTYSPEKSLASFFFEVGVVKRIVLKDQDLEYSNYLINSKGEYLEISPNEFYPKNLIRPVFAIGAERRLETSSGNSGSYFSIGSVLSTSFPATSVNAGSLFYVDVSTIGLAVFCRFHF